jgi:amino acid transporter
MDSTYVIQAERVATTDTIYYQINKKDLKALYGQVFDEMIDEESAKDHITLTITYVPLVLIFMLLISLVNIRWNRAYKRIKDKEPIADLCDEDKENIKKLDLQFYKVPDRIFFYLVVWSVSAIFDSLMILNDIFDIPWAAILAAIYTMTKVITRLVGGSTLMGVNDSDLVKHYGKHIKNMVVDSITDKIKNIIKEK